jgi:hypothetical protein
MKWLINKLTVVGNIQAFCEEAKGFDRQYERTEAEKKALMRLYQQELPKENINHLCFHALVPIPPKILEGEYKKGYDWELSNWGCMWGATDVKVTTIEKGVVYRFKTPNFAPIPWVDKVANLYPDLNFTLTFREGTGLRKIIWEKV